MMTSAQFIAVTTNDVGPAGPMKKIFAAGFETAEEALNVVEARLKPGEQAKWLERRSLAIRPGEVRSV
jgi:hypothetical protein